MNFRIVATSAVVVVAAAAAGGYFWAHRTVELKPQEQWAMLDRYCVSCHNQTELAGDLGFDRMQVENLHADAKTWEMAIR